MKIQLSLTAAMLLCTAFNLFAEDRYRVKTRIVHFPKSINPIKAQQVTEDEFKMLMRDIAPRKDVGIMTAPSILLPANKTGHIEVVEPAKLQRINEHFTDDYGLKISIHIDTKAAKPRLKGAYKHSSFQVIDAKEDIEQTSINTRELLFDVAFKSGETVLLGDGETLVAITVGKL
jgi:hypothetical protein